MKSSVLRRFAASLTTAAMIGSLLATVAGPGTVLAGFTSPACPFADVETATECQITAAWTVGGGGVTGNNFPAGLPGPFVFHKTLHIFAGGNINASTSGGPGITLTIDGASGGTGALVMDAGASVIDTSDIAGNNQPGGPITISATGGATFAAGSRIISENNFVNLNAGNIGLSFGASSTFAGEISSQATAGTTGNNGGDITIGITGDLTMAAGSEIISQKNADGGKAGDIAISVSGNMLMQGGNPGALISSEHPGATNGHPGGNITIDVGTGDAGVFTMESGSLVASSSRGRAGNIAITAGETVDVQAGAQVLAGQRATQDTQGHGGRIFVIAGCEARIFGTLSSQGKDPGADLVHVEGCEVHVGPTGLIESTASGHAPITPTSCDGVDDPTQIGTGPFEPGGDAGEVLRHDHPANSTVCVEIWGRHITIDQGGQVNADFALDGDIQGHGWADVFGEADITINGPATTGFAVHSNSFLGNDVAGDIRVKATTFVTMTGRALAANALGNGSDGGSLVVEASGPVNLDTATLEARGDNSGVGDPCDSGMGACGEGGTIDVRSFNDAISWQNGVGNVNPDQGASPPAGNITLTACTTVTTTGSTFDDELPTVNAGAAFCAVGPSFPVYVVFNPGGRWDRCGELRISGLKFNDLNNNSANDGEPGLPGWTIHVTGPGGFDATVVTGADGTYSVVLTGGPGTYTVCEVIANQPGWTQTFPDPGPGVVACSGAGEAPLGYSVDTTQGLGACCEGAHFTGKDFGNVQPTFDCPEDRARTSLITRTVGKPDAPVPNYNTLQAAYDAAKFSSGAEVIGMFSETHENVVLNTYAGASMMITQCTTAKITALDPGLPVWAITSTKKLTIIGPDSVGGTIGWLLENQNSAYHDLKSIRSNGASVAGVRIAVGSNYNTISFNNVASVGIGVDVLGNRNTLKSGTIGPSSSTPVTGIGVHFGPASSYNTVSGATILGNSGNGIWIEGSRNTVSSLKALSNGLNGILVAGTSHTIKSNQVDSNGSDGVNVPGTSNTFQDNKVSKNAGDGFDISGTGNTLKSNASNNGSSGGSTENSGAEYVRSVAVTNGGSNKADGTSIPSASKCSTFFTSTTSCE